MKIIIQGQIRGGKNNMIVLRNGMHIPKPEWRKWRDQAVAQVVSQTSGQPKFKKPMALLCGIKYTPSDARRRDVPAILDSIWHVLERAGIVEDDSQIKQVSFFTGCKDTDNPRAEIIIDEIFSFK